MTDPFTASALLTLAFTTAFQTSIEKVTENVAGQVGKKLNQLRQAIWQKIKGRPKAEEALAKIEGGLSSEAELEAEIAKVAPYLQVAMDEDEEFDAQVQGLAQEISQVIAKIEGNQSKNAQINLGGNNQQVNDPKGTTINEMRGNINNYYGNPPSD